MKPVSAEVVRFDSPPLPLFRESELSGSPATSRNPFCSLFTNPAFGSFGTKFMRMRDSAGVSHTLSHAGFREVACSCLRHSPSIDQLWSAYGICAPPMNHLFEQQGFAIVPHVLTTSEREQLIESL